MSNLTLSLYFDVDSIRVRQTLNGRIISNTVQN